MMDAGEPLAREGPRRGFAAVIYGRHRRNRMSDLLAARLGGAPMQLRTGQLYIHRAARVVGR